MNKRISVLLAEDHVIVRDGLRVLLNREDDIHVVAEASNGRQAVELARQLQPSVIVMDIAMPLLNGVEATRQILQIHPNTKILILSAHCDDAYVERVIALGAAGFLTKQTAADLLPKAIRDIFAGRPCFSSVVAKRLLYHRRKAQAAGELNAALGIPALTSREMEVLQLIAEGKANKETAELLVISMKTVEKHRQKVMDKLNIHDTAGLTRYAIAAGIIESSKQETTSLSPETSWGSLDPLGEHLLPFGV